MILLLILFLCALLGISALFASSEVSLFSLSSIKLQLFKKQEDKRKQLVAHLLSSPQDLLVTILMVNIITNILIQNTVSGLFGSFSGWALNVGVPLVLILIFGDVLPKSVGLAYNSAIAYRVAPLLYFVQKVFYPVRKVLIGITGIVSSVLFFFLKKEEEISLEELQHALKTSRHAGVLNEDEAELIRGYLLLKEARVNELMRPREEVLFFDLDDSLSKLIHLFVDKQCSRVPICRNGLDEVIGIMTASSYFINKERLERTEDLAHYIDKPFFVHERMDADALLSKMYEKQESLALVVDEYGAISGLIAFEDLIEKVIGEIADARDEMSRFTRSSKDVIIASGKMELAEFEEVFNVELHSENHLVTVGGWLTEQVGDIPKTGSKYTLHGFLFHVLAADVKRIRRIYIRKLESPK
ncbi:MAG: hypothetical protein RLZZ453_1305 [Chlamydiota bacterium]|jgi:CBS domain containing-hemolysin-like protein